VISIIMRFRDTGCYKDHPMNHWLRKEGMNMVSSNMVKVDGIDTVEEHFHLINH
jgi:hypothetical protein